MAESLNIDIAKTSVCQQRYLDSALLLCDLKNEVLVIRFLWK